MINLKVLVLGRIFSSKLNQNQGNDSSFASFAVAIAKLSMNTAHC